MYMCRACLSTEREMIPLDEVYVSKYNLLTSLNVALMDGMPQFICRDCLETVNVFIEFRDKSVLSESTLREILQASVKSEDDDNVQQIKEAINDNPCIKQEIKDELKNEDTNSDNVYELLDKYEEIDYLFLKEVKGPKLSKGKRRPKVNKKIDGKVNFKIPDIKDEDNGKLYCGICVKMFENSDELNHHLENHKNDKHCQQCTEIFDGWAQLLGHRLIHVPTKQKHCHICGKRFVSCDYLEYHYRNMHVKDEGTKLRCKQCYSLYDNPRKLKKHMWSIHGEKKYICDYCSKRFQNKSSLRSHVVSHTGTKAYVCDICGFKSKFIGGLKKMKVIRMIMKIVNANIHDDDDDSKDHAELQNVQTTNNPKEERHDHKIRRHSTTKVYCKTCQRPFQTQQDHDKHKCDKKVVMCPVCGIQFSRNMKLSRHMNTHSDIRKFECNRCPAKFKTKHALQAHHDRHDGNRTKHCEYCPAKFYTGSSLIKHRRIHTGEKPYVCKVCNKGFTGNHNLKVHMKVHGEYNLIVKKNKEPDTNDVISIC